MFKVQGLSHDPGCRLQVWQGVAGCAKINIGNWCV